MKQSLKLCALLCFLMLLGCAPRPFESANQNGRNVAGSVFGGAAGLAGSAALRSPPVIFIGAGVGGAALGYYMASIRFDAGPIYHAGGSVYVQGRYVGINIPSYQLFEDNTSEFLPTAEPILNSAVAVLKRYPNHNIFISGNTSGFGSARDDKKLSTARAREVAAFLWARGIQNFKWQDNEMRKLKFAGNGHHFPIASDIHPENLQENGRIQITAFPSPADLQPGKRETLYKNMGSLSD